MVRYRLLDFLRKRKKFQTVVFSFLLFVFSIYILFLSLNVYNLVCMLVLNTKMVEVSEGVDEIDSYELDGTTLTIGNDSYENVFISFYGVSTDNNAAYFDKGENTLILSIPDKYGIPFLIGANAFMVLIFEVMVAVFAFLTCQYKRVGVSFLVLSVILFLVILFTIVILL